MASNRRTSSHDGPSGNDVCEKTRGVRMDARQSFTAPAPCSRKTKESPECFAKGLNSLPRATTRIEQLLEDHVDLTRSDLVQRSTLDVHLIEKLRDDTATPTDGLGPKPFFIRHVIRKRLDLPLTRSESSRALLQTPHELKPLDGKRKAGRLVTHFVCDLAEGQSLSRPTGQSQHVCNRKQIMGFPTQSAPGVALAGEMCQEGDTFSY